jgi:osmotically-inducible protein OsmY
MISDNQLRQDVLDELKFEPSVDAARIGVGVNAGVVTLTGIVSSYGEKLAAERAAQRVKGVKAVAQEIEVRLPRSIADYDIAARIVEVFKWRAGLPTDRIDIKVEKGIVTLSGNVDWQFQKSEAEAAIRNLAGLLDVVNVIWVRAPVAVPEVGPVQASEVREKIQNALERRAELDAARITVETEGSKVILGGTVHAWYERDAAEQAAWSAPGVVEVQDRIQVDPYA